MTITLTHEPPVKQATAILESAVAALVQGPNDPIRLERADQLPNPTRTACSIVNAAIEACNGTRPLHQLLGWVSPDVYEALSARAQVLTHRLQRSDQRWAPVQNTGEGRTTNKIIRARVIRISHLAAEATVIIDDGNRVRAAALRLEEHRGRWQVTVLEIG